MIRALLVVAILAGCGGGATDADTEANACDAVPRSTLDTIEDGLTVQGGGTLRSGRAMQLGDWWYVAAEIDGPGLEEAGDVGVWAMPDKDEPGPLFAVDGVAREFSEWGVAGDIDTLEENFGFSRSDASQAADCL